MVPFDQFTRSMSKVMSMIRPALARYESWHLAGARACVNHGA